jgi:hypothetical protein
LQNWQEGNQKVDPNPYIGELLVPDIWVIIVSLDWGMNFLIYSETHLDSALYRELAADFEAYNREIPC